MRLLLILKPKGNTAYFLISLLLFILLTPHFSDTAPHIPIQSILYIAILLTGVYAVCDSAVKFIIGALLGVPWLIVNWVAMFAPGRDITILSLILGAAFILFTIYETLKSVFRTRTVTMETIYGATCAYILMGFFWTMLYMWNQLARPGSYECITCITIDGLFSISDMMFFSFVTLTTLGYGDITPVGAHARSLAMIQVIVGQLYLTVLVARLMGLHIAHRMSK